MPNEQLRMQNYGMYYTVHVHVPLGEPYTGSPLPLSL